MQKNAVPILSTLLHISLGILQNTALEVGNHSHIYKYVVLIGQTSLKTPQKEVFNYRNPDQENHNSSFPDLSSRGRLKDQVVYLPALYTRSMQDLTSCWQSTRGHTKKDQPWRGPKPTHTYPITPPAPGDELQSKPSRLPHWNGYKTLDQKIERNITSAFEEKQDEKDDFRRSPYERAKKSTPF